MRKAVLASLILIVGFGCNYNHVKGSGLALGNGANSETMNASLDYSSVNNLVLANSCVRCHSVAGGAKGGLNLETYEEVRVASNRIYYRSIEAKDMPPDRPLDPGQATLLQAWLEVGAPEKGNGKKPGKKVSGPVNWQIIKTNILQDSCLDCHSGDHPDANLNFETLESVKAHIQEILKSAVFDLTMPIAPYPTLSASEKETLMKWVAEGFPK